MKDIHMRRLAIMAILLLWPALASADPFAEAIGRYKLLPASRIHFSVAQAGGAAIEGDFTRFSGTFALDRDIGRSKVEISLSSGSIRAVDPRIEDFIKSASVFDAANHPTISFRSSAVVRTGENTATIQGQLTAKGLTRPTTFQVTYRGRDAGRLKFHVTGKISRALFNMDVGTPIYSNVVVLDMDLLGGKM